MADEFDKQFPIQADKTYKGSTIPWWLAEIAYEKYVSIFGNSQSLERLAERGGFCRKELLFLLGCISENEL